MLFPNGPNSQSKIREKQSLKEVEREIEIETETERERLRGRLEVGFVQWCPLRLGFLQGCFGFIPLLQEVAPAINWDFSDDNQARYCVLEGFKLDCSGNQYPIIRFEALEFRVLNINQFNETMTIARLDPSGMDLVLKTTSVPLWIILF